ncbi:Gibberellin 2-beta-dioxygenase [Platanthera zijinensis]|uniref:Gibberellin 2-beta-dioxygenase n=1 Tax=Platanthera zijinensis TaxID=2320716 RepID=A0AAP0ASZ4_9ASPA
MHTIVDLNSPTAPAQLVSACEELGFFKLTNHTISLNLMENLEDEAVKFFSLPLWKKDAAGAAPSVTAAAGLATWATSALNEYITAVKKLACELLELMAEGLGLRPRNALSKLLMDEESDLILRLNHYPPCPVSRESSSGGVTGFGEHTDPQVISILRSNNTWGLQVLPRDGRWVPVPPDQSSFFVNVGDSLQMLPALTDSPQVLTNGRFKSVKHRVLTNSLQSRVSMIFFGGPPLKERVAPLPHLMEEGEESLYREFTWCEYKATAYASKLVDNRLELFEKR